MNKKVIKCILARLSIGPAYRLPLLLITAEAIGVWDDDEEIITNMTAAEDALSSALIELQSSEKISIVQKGENAVITLIVQV